MRDRGWRRAQRARKIAAIERWMRDRGLHSGRQVTVEQSHAMYAQWARRRHSAPTTCSGFCCGNPRKHFGERTLAEQRFGDAFFKQVDETVADGLQGAMDDGKEA